MQRRKSFGLGPRFRLPEPLYTQIKLAAMIASAAAPLLAVALLAPPPLVLPVLCLIALAGAAVSALVAWRRDEGRDSPRITAWDVAGAFVLVACATAIMSDPDQVASLLAPTTVLSDLSGAAHGPYR